MSWKITLCIKSVHFITLQYQKDAENLYSTKNDDTTVDNKYMYVKYHP